MTYMVNTEFNLNGFSGTATWAEDSAGYPGDPAEGVIIVEIDLETEDGSVTLNKHTKDYFRKAVWSGLQEMLYGSKYEEYACEELHDLYAEELF